MARSHVSPNSPACRGARIGGMMRGMNRRWTLRIARGFVLLALLAAMVGPASVALASRQDEPDEVIVDARMEGYPTFQEMPEGSNGGTWVVFVLLLVITAGGLFKDAKRTHL